MELIGNIRSMFGGSKYSESQIESKYLEKHNSIDASMLEFGTQMSKGNPDFTLIEICTAIENQKIEKDRNFDNKIEEAFQKKYDRKPTKMEMKKVKSDDRYNEYKIRDNVNLNTLLIFMMMDSSSMASDSELLSDNIDLIQEEELLSDSIDNIPTSSYSSENTISEPESLYDSSGTESGSGDSSWTGSGSGDSSGTGSGSGSGSGDSSGSGSGSGCSGSGSGCGS